MTPGILDHVNVVRRLPAFWQSRPGWSKASIEPRRWPNGRCRIFGGGDADMVAAHLFYREMRMADQRERQESDPVLVFAGYGA